MSLVVKDVWKSFGGRDVLRGVTLAVSSGERVALMGRNGCGKSTLLRIVAGHTDPDGGRVQLARRARLGFLAQELGELGTGDAVAEAAKGLGDLLDLEERLLALTKALAARGNDELLLRQYGTVEAQFRARDGYRWQQRVKAVLMGLGLPEDSLHRSATLLSGGERMRVELARLLLQEPDILLLDEPTNHLDLEATQWLESFLCSYSGACLIVSHDRYLLDAVAQRVVELEDGVATEYRGNFSAYSREKARRLQETIQSNEDLNWQIRRDSQVAAQLRSLGRHRAAASRLQAIDRKRQELRAPGGDGQRLAINFKQPEWTSKLIAEAEDVVKVYGSRRVLNGVSFQIAGGERVGIIGPNGAGKTTLLRLLVGEEQATQGRIRLGPWVDYAYLGQVKGFADPKRSVLDEVLSSTPHLTAGEARNRLARFLFSNERVFQQIHSLSGGEKSRLALLCAILQEPHCLILDEPTNHLDVPSRECLEEALTEFRGTVIAVSHDRFFLNRVMTRMLVLADGRIRSFTGNYSAYRKAIALGGISQVGQEKSIRNVTVTGKQMSPRQKSRQAQVRSRSQERLVDVEKEIAALERRIRDLERQFQQPDFFRDRSSHHALQEHQSLLEQLAVLYEAWGSQQQ